MKQFNLFLMLFFACTFVSLTNAQVKVGKKVVGDWKYEAAQAPYGYDKGVISIKEQKDALSGDVKFDSGYSVKLQSVSFKNDTLRISVYVESEYVDVVTKVTGNKMEGTVNSSMGKMAIKADKVFPAVKK